MKTTIIALSDLHGRLPDVPKCDILVIAGDICPCFHRTHYHGQPEWMRGAFKQWLWTQPVEHTILTAGNHDWVWYQAPEMVGGAKPYRMLIDSSVELRGIKFHGTPWQLPFNNWAFNLDEDGLTEKYKLIPHDTDLLISHGPPFGYLDAVATHPWDHLGSKALARAIEEHNTPLTIFGHIHSGHGIQLHQGRYYVNASILNEEYHQVYPPIKIEYEDNRLLSVEQL